MFAPSTLGPRAIGNALGFPGDLSTQCTRVCPLKGADTVE
jgi:hypothetical protein